MFYFILGYLITGIFSILLAFIHCGIDKKKSPLRVSFNDVFDDRLSPPLFIHILCAPVVVIAMFIGIALSLSEGNKIGELSLADIGNMIIKPFKRS